MSQKLLSPKSIVPKAKDDRLFSGIWLCWSALSAAERLVCANIVLWPIWWLGGIPQHMPLIILVAIALYEWRCHGGIRLKRPGFVVVALFAFYGFAYVEALLLFFNLHPFIDLPPNFARSPISLVRSVFVLIVPCLVWYIQSNDVRVRLEVVAWACSVSAVQMLVSWLVVQFLFPGACHSTPLTLYGLITGKNTEYIHGYGASNYLIFCESDRVAFFFGHKQIAAAYLGFISLLALDIKNRLWSLLLLGSCIFLLSLTGSRTLLLAVPAAMLIRFLVIFVVVKVRLAWLLLAFLSIVSFATLSLPPVTDLTISHYTATAEAVGGFNQDSTDTRAGIYKETLEKIPEQLLFGHGTQENVNSSTTGQEAIGVDYPLGSHSFILGQLLYLRGLVGAGIFATFFGALIIWFYRTRSGRPLCWSSILILFTLISCIAPINYVMEMCILMCLVMRRPTTKALNRRAAIMYA